MAAIGLPTVVGHSAGEAEAEVGLYCHLRNLGHLKAWLVGARSGQALSTSLGFIVGVRRGPISLQGWVGRSRAWRIDPTAVGLDAQEVGIRGRWHLLPGGFVSASLSRLVASGSDRAFGEGIAGRDAAYGLCLGGGLRIGGFWVVVGYEPPWAQWLGDIAVPLVRDGASHYLGFGFSLALGEAEERPAEDDASPDAVAQVPLPEPEPILDAADTAPSPTAPSIIGVEPGGTEIPAALGKEIVFTVGYRDSDADVVAVEVVGALNDVRTETRADGLPIVRFAGRSSLVRAIRVPVQPGLVRGEVTFALRSDEPAAPLDISLRVRDARGRISEPAAFTIVTTASEQELRVQRHAVVSLYLMLGFLAFAYLLSFG
jgi:hypothetical protein